MISVDSKTMREIDKYCIEKLGIPGIILMENAAIKVSEEVEGVLSSLERDRVVIVCGVGNNGGDGIAVARHLFLKGYKTSVFIVGNLDKGSYDFNTNLQIIKKINEIENNKITIDVIDDENFDEFKRLISKTSVVVDGIFGTGLKRDVEGIYKRVISEINNSKKHIISIDVPSGLNSDDGNVMGISIEADETITLQLYKTGFLNEESKKYCGDIRVVDIGIPRRVIESISK